MASDEMLAPSKTCVGAEESHGRSVGGGYDHPCRAPQLLLLHGKEDRTPPICRDGVEEDEGGFWTSHPRKRERRESSPPVAEEGQVFRTEEKTAMAGEAVAGSLTRLVCSRCGTSRTPMWRSGPAGPKTLCNACGIRYRKMRRTGGVSSFAAAASAGDDPQKQEAAAADEEEARNQGEKLQRRQRRRREVLWMLLRESKRFSFRCGEEEAEAAVLLMAISSGLFVHTSH